MRKVSIDRTAQLNAETNMAKLKNNYDRVYHNLHHKKRRPQREYESNYKHKTSTNLKVEIKVTNVNFLFLYFQKTHQISYNLEKIIK